MGSKKVRVLFCGVSFHPWSCHGWTTAASHCGIPSYLLQRLQSVMNSAARLVFSSSKYTTQSLRLYLHQLHCLKAPEKIQYKLAVLTLKCLHRTAPLYLADEFIRSSDLEARGRLRSASSLSLIVHRTWLSTVGDRALPLLVSGTNCHATH